MYKIFKLIRKNKHFKLLRDMLSLIKYRILIDVLDRSTTIMLVRSKKYDYPIWFPYNKFIDFDIGQLEMLDHGYIRWMAEKYITPFNLIHPGDTVIDCGAFIGGFSLASLKYTPKKIIAIEPSSNTVAALKKNLVAANNANIIQCALGDINKEAIINLSVTGVENSLLKPDQYSSGLSEPCRVLTFDDIVDKFNIDPNESVLKVEAEGYEYEVIMGVCKYLPKKIVIDISPEGGRISPKERIKFLLTAKGYNKFLETTRCLYAELG